MEFLPDSVAKIAAVAPLAVVGGMFLKINHTLVSLSGVETLFSLLSFLALFLINQITIWFSNKHRCFSFFFPVLQGFFFFFLFRQPKTFDNNCLGLLIRSS